MFGRRPDATQVTGLPTIRRFMPFHFAAAK